MTHKQRLKAALCAWRDEQVRLGIYKNKMTLYSKVQKQLFGSNSDEIMKRYMYGTSYPILEKHVMPLHRLSGIPKHILNPQAFKKGE